MNKKNKSKIPEAVLTNEELEKEYLEILDKVNRIEKVIKYRACTDTELKFKDIKVKRYHNYGINEKLLLANIQPLEEIYGENFSKLYRRNLLLKEYNKFMAQLRRDPQYDYMFYTKLRGYTPLMSLLVKSDRMFLKSIAKKRLARVTIEVIKKRKYKTKRLKEI